MEKEGRETAKLRTDLLTKDFKLVPVDLEITEKSAELRHKYGILLADSIIAATAQKIKGKCVTDNPHLTKIKEIETTWIT